MGASQSTPVAPALDALNMFTMTLFRTLAANVNMRTRDIVTSPLNVLLAMTMAVAAAKPGSTTSRELCLALSIEPDGPEDAFLDALGALTDSLTAADPLVRLTIANSVWAKRVRRSYDERMHASLRADSFELPRDAGPINAWCNERTGGLVPSILSHLDSSTVAVLVSAIYFKGAWSSAFDKAATHTATFHGLDAAVDCPMMRKTIKATDDFWRCGELAGTHVLELAYGSGRLRTLIGLPSEATVAGLDAACDALFGASGARSVLASLGKPRNTVIHLSLPRFTSELGIDLVETFRTLGVSQAFGEGADFSRLNATASAHISAILHKAVLKVNEQGAEAAAAETVHRVTLRHVERDVKAIRFDVDRPFAFAIVDTETWVVLFAARIVQPKFE